ncbi:glycerol kinase GlpK [Erysipelothrix tonsillarum]|uniref:glycerol kinase GlpK n=1 Tax=Erysipelothrix tonsillarum TaxID=38402 RepID=UPI0003760E9B|nr:glycerol kinase GlpK [Erysipelothrix tonsillarum]
MKDYIITLDQGTTSSRAIIFDKDYNLITKAQTETTQIYPQQGWVEQDPMEIWATQSGVLNEVLARAGISPEQIETIGITNQRETTVVWNRHTGRPIYNAIVWQCRRTAPICDELHEAGLSDYIKANTGLIIDAYFSGTKVKWILDHVEGARELAERGDLLFGTVDSWLLYKLTGGKVHATDYTNASRTMLYNIKALEWDQTILNALNIPTSMLPKVCDSSHLYGYTNIQGYQIPITSMVGDQQAALFGQTCFNSGDVKNTYGTGCFLLMNTKDQFVESKNGLLTTIAIALDGKVEYALEGSVFVAGAVIQWLRDELGIIDDAADVEYFAQKVPDSGGVYFVPALTGLGAPYWDMDATGTIFGLTRGTNKNHIIRAALESIAYQSYDIMKAMEDDSRIKIKSLKVDGGASSNDFLMQFQADLLDVNVQRSFTPESTSLGACFLAGLQTGFFKDKTTLLNGQNKNKAWDNRISDEERKQKLAAWHHAIARTLTK